MKVKIHIVTLIVLISSIMFFGDTSLLRAQAPASFRIARLKYRGGDDWYNDPSSLTNLINYARKYVTISISTDYDDISVGSQDLFKYPFAFITGHGTLEINEEEAKNLREYADNGGFIYIDDDYGFDTAVRKALKKIFPNDKMIELPFSHPIYHQVFDFPNGLPKIHKHDGKPAQGFGIFRHGRLVMFYTYQTNLADGWADQDIHHDPQYKRIEALKMGVNILVYALTH